MALLVVGVLLFTATALFYNRRVEANSPVAAIITREARTDYIGDCNFFISAVEDAVRTRTGVRGIDTI